MSTLNIGTNVQISGTNQTVTGLRYAEGIVPAGSVIFVARATVPDGYLPCNGSNTVSRTTFATLFAGIGTVFGAGDGINTFGVPDLRGEFIRGLDNGRGVDTGRTLGSAQFGSRTYLPLNALPYNTPSYNQPNNAPSSSLFDETFTGGYLADPSFGVGKIYGSLSTENVLGTVRPRNIALLACIKY